MSKGAWVTLATNDSYGLGALVLAHSLRRVGSVNPAVVLITPSVTEAMRNRLNAVFAEVITVDVLDSKDAAHLALLARPELGITFTKIHCWSLIQYEKCVFLDADTLVVQNCDELFEREELSAAPDVGWPDCFNSGVFVFRPSQDTFDKLIKFAQERGSFDGGDQGLLNSFFSDWAHGDINKHLPFLYNVTSAAFYSYLPALKHFGQDLKIIHFIGAAKPWLQHFNWQTRTVDAQDHLRGLLQVWWDLFVGQVHPQLETSMTGVAGNLARIVPGESGSNNEAIDELTRRQGWEAGNIDYLGADSFDNIWAKISQTLNQQPQKQPSPPRKEPSPPKQPSPPKEQLREAVPAPPSEVTESVPVQAAEAPEVAAPAVAALELAAPATLAAVETPATVETSAPAASIETPATEVPKSGEAPKVDAPVETPAPVPEVPVPVLAAESAPPAPSLATEPAKVEITEKTDKTIVPPTPPVTPKSTPEASTPVSEEPPKLEAQKESLPATEREATLTTPEASSAPAVTPSTDSPPLANTPSKEEAPPVPAAKSTEEAAQETRL